MNKYKILFIDEEEMERIDFRIYVEDNDSEKVFDLRTPEPGHILNDFVSTIINENYDAIITDHNLKSSNSAIQYDGLMLVEAILEVRYNFPCFILTSYEDDAIRDGKDVNIVYIKDIMVPEEEKNHQVKFIDRVKNQIEHHRKKIKDIEDEIKVLVARKDLNADEEIRLLELDSTLEKMTNQPSSIPSKFKSKTNLEALHKLIDNTDQLLKSLK
ncbi:hypothetical protein [Francisella philomiragia]|uniref:Response regulator n=1 Tax=Francisella philomiragia TaxID=28110 RepID=A0ABS1GA64_9GAMM|nr:hypothetical protein [Francisella philomiragia]MBK2258020.1 hypothetical protein [Francisella philomiragia]MBK2267221.1 hypothetical protein [Francisella philomiragia]MBK2278766.1 hypothetical protein [Francisella philomiragia]MBK2286620.1 hypothetical protein [Francisella philomiragia]MBK2288506.1 hypothetical protein [Francisella philomiragia]